MESETRNISVLRKPPQTFWFSNMLISFWLCLFFRKKLFATATFNGLWVVYFQAD